MDFLIQMAWRNVLRHRRRSLLTTTAVTLGIGLLTLALSFFGGVMSGFMEAGADMAGHVRVVHPEYQRREQLFPLYENIPESAPVTQAVAAAPGVTGAYARITMPVAASTGEEIGEAFGQLQGAEDAYFQDVLDLPGKLVAGEMFAGERQAVLGHLFAEDAGVDVGGEVILIGQTQDGALSPVKLTVTGVADMGNQLQNRMGFIGLEDIRYLADIPGGATEVLAFGEDWRAARALAEDLQGLPALAGLTTESWDMRPLYAQMIQIADAQDRIVSGVLVFISALVVLNTMLMSVLERTPEVGVLRAMGMRRRDTVAMFLIEGGILSLVGGLIGVALGGAGGLWLEINGVDLGPFIEDIPTPFPINHVVRADVGPEVLAAGLALALATALIGGLLPAIRAARILPVEAMRRRR